MSNEADLSLIPAIYHRRARIIIEKILEKPRWRSRLSRRYRHLLQNVPEGTDPPEIDLDWAREPVMVQALSDELTRRLWALAQKDPRYRIGAELENEDVPSEQDILGYRVYSELLCQRLGSDDKAISTSAEREVRAYAEECIWSCRPRARTEERAGQPGFGQLKFWSRRAYVDLDESVGNCCGISLDRVVTWRRKQATSGDAGFTWWLRNTWAGQAIANEIEWLRPRAEDRTEIVERSSASEEQQDDVPRGPDLVSPSRIDDEQPAVRIPRGTEEAAVRLQIARFLLTQLYGLTRVPGPEPPPLTREDVLLLLLVAFVRKPEGRLIRIKEWEVAGSRGVERMAVWLEAHMGARSEDAARAARWLYPAVMKLSQNAYYDWLTYHTARAKDKAGRHTAFRQALRELVLAPDFQFSDDPTTQPEEEAT